MLWLEMTSDMMGEAIERCGGVCLLPMGVMERHGSHLPLGTDQFVVDEICRRAAEAEPAVVFPSYYFGKIFTARHSKGTFALRRDLLLPVLEATIDEIARSGFTKIMLVNGHGGNTTMINFYVRTLLDEPHDYMVYATDTYHLEPEDEAEWKAMCAADWGEHGGEDETSVMLHVRGDLCRMQDLTSPEDGEPRGRQDGLRGMQNPLTWYADFPTHYSGDARQASAEKGAWLVERRVAKLARDIRAVKEDAVSRNLLQEFYDRSENPE